ncbi:MAG: permease [Alteromonadaceae bacterium]|nr:permease [Alteromonadaceae bacterium]
MRIGMSFGVLLGALLHTYLHYFPLQLSASLRMNSFKGAIVGAPMGICANCAVPTVCGLTRGKGRIEMALGFLFSSPNFNPVVVMMTVITFPVLMSFTKYALLIFVILFLVPVLIGWLEKRGMHNNYTAEIEINDQCQISTIQPVQPKRWATFIEIAQVYAKSAWMLIKPTITIMIFASLLSSTLLILIPWTELLAQVTVTSQLNINRSS